MLSQSWFNYLNSARFIWLGYFLGSGLCLGIGFVTPTLWLIVFPGLVLYFVGIKKSSSLRQVALGGFLTWTVKLLLALTWFWSTYPVIWVDLGLGRAELPAVGFYWFSVSVFIGLAGIFCSGILWTIYRYLNQKWFLIIVPFVFVVCEVLGSFFFSFFTLGEGIKPNVIFSFGYLGYLLAEHEWFIQLSRWGGVYLLTLVVVTMGVVLWWRMERSKYSEKSLDGLLLVLILLALTSHFGFNKYFANGVVAKGVRVAVVDTSFGGSDYFAMEDRESYRRDQIVEALAVALKEEPDYVVMPEDSRYIDPQLGAKAAYALFRFQQSDPWAVVVEAGPVDLADGGRTLRATIYDGVNKTAYAVDKQYLVPQGEFMPRFTKGTLSLLGLGESAEIIDDKLIYQAGPLSSQMDIKTSVPGVLFCFSSVDPNGVRKLLKERTMPFIAHPVSHAWFHDSVILNQQLDAMLRVQAVWNQVPIVSAGNMAQGFLYTENGQKIKPTLVEKGESWRVSLVSI